jgi:3',5'-cyclic AMP phosphodiesterase CpdA
MRRVALAWLTCGMLGGLAAFAALPASAAIRIGIIGDQTGAADLDKAYAVLQQGVDALKSQTLDIVLHVGDLVESTSQPDEIRRRFAQATTILSQLPVQWYMTAGDHDVNPPVWTPNSPDRSREQLFQSLYGAINPLVQQQLYYSFDLNNYHFVVLYSLEALDTDPRWGNVFYSRVSDAQYAWLTNDLAANAANKSGIMVLLHHPMWYMWSDWDRVHRLLAQYRVNTVIAGHFHYNQVDSRIDGIQYHVVGATGGDTKRGTPNAGALQHVSVLTINDDRSLDFRMIPLAPYVQIVWTGRQVMDRVQAVDSLLGNLWSFAGNSPVFLQNGALVAACGTSAPAKLLLSQLGNATAAPVDVSISVTPSVTVAGSFGDGFCLQDVGPFSCRLRNPPVWACRTRRRFKPPSARRRSGPAPSRPRALPPPSETRSA